MRKESLQSKLILLSVSGLGEIVSNVGVPGSEVYVVGGGLLPPFPGSIAKNCKLKSTKGIIPTEIKSKPMIISLFLSIFYILTNLLITRLLRDLIITYNITVAIIITATNNNIFHILPNKPPNKPPKISHKSSFCTGTSTL